MSCRGIKSVTGASQRKPVASQILPNSVGKCLSDFQKSMKWESI